MQRLVKHLAQRGTVQSKSVADVLLSVDRGTFVAALQADAGEAYEDHPLPIGHGQTISAPHMHATALELLKDKLVPGARALDVGSGSGYLTACMGLMVSPGGSVLGVEVVQQLATRSVDALQQVVPDLLNDGTITVRPGNVLTDHRVLEAEGPFDAIHVGAAAAHLPQQLVDKLAPGGRMVIPVGPQWSYQVLQVVDREPGPGGRVTVRSMMDVGYVPLVGS